jgi:OOP family OmpA-OmpF porin
MTLIREAGPAASFRVLVKLMIVWLLSSLLATVGARAETAWTLDPASSTLTYQSIKNNAVVETNTIRNISGEIAPSGAAKISFDLNSVDTGVDLRNVRMRFLFFETFKFPTAELTATLDPAAFAELATKRRINATVPYRLSLHGIEKDMTADVVVTAITDTTVSVASRSPVTVNVADFDLAQGVEKLKQAANVGSIVPSASVSFDLVFARGGQAPAVQPVAQAPSGEVAAATQVAALGAAGPVATDADKATYSEEECFNRFEVLSRTGAIYFRTASARLDPKSKPMLDQVLDVVTKCPTLQVEVSGHTDADGSEDANLRLSERRAAAVADHIVGAGIPRAQITAAGYGETRPVVGNDTAENKALNRRIEFSATRAAN